MENPPSFFWHNALGLRWTIPCCLLLLMYLHVQTIIAAWPHENFLLQGLGRLGRYCEPRIFVVTLVIVLHSLGLAATASWRQLRRPPLKRFLVLAGFCLIVSWLSAHQWAPPNDWSPIFFLTNLMFDFLLVGGVLLFRRHTGVRRWLDATATAPALQPERNDPFRIAVAAPAIANLFIFLIPGMPFIRAPFLYPELAFQRETYYFSKMHFATAATPFFALGQIPLRRLFGQTILGSHLISVLLVTIACTFVYAAVTRLWGRTAGLLAAAFLCTQGRLFFTALIGHQLATVLPAPAIGLYLVARLRHDGLDTIHAGKGFAFYLRSLGVSLLLGLFVISLAYSYSVIRLPLAALLPILAFYYYRYLRRQNLSFDFLYWFLKLPVVLAPVLFLLFIYRFDYLKTYHELIENSSYFPVPQRVGKAPEGVSFEITMHNPDEPVWIGEVGYVSLPDADKYPQEGGIYWVRAPAELWRAVRTHWAAVLGRTANTFPGMAYCDLLFLAGLIVIRWYFGALRGLAALLLSLAYTASYLLIAGPNDYRRGYTFFLVYAPISVMSVYPLLQSLRAGLPARTPRLITRGLPALLAASLLLVRFSVEYVRIAETHEVLETPPQCSNFPLRELADEAYLRAFSGKHFILWNPYYEWFHNQFCYDVIAQTREFEHYFPSAALIQSQNPETIIELLRTLGPKDVFVLDCSEFIITASNELFRRPCAYVAEHAAEFEVHEAFPRTADQSAKNRVLYVERRW